LNREGAKDAKGYIFFHDQVNDHEKLNAIQLCKSIVAAARRSHVLCLTWRALRLERSGRLVCS